MQEGNLGTSEWTLKAGEHSVLTCALVQLCICPILRLAFETWCVPVPIDPAHIYGDQRTEFLPSGSSRCTEETAVPKGVARQDAPPPFLAPALPYSPSLQGPSLLSSLPGLTH
jgi:hypothetical protein